MNFLLGEVSSHGWFNSRQLPKTYQLVVGMVEPRYEPCAGHAGIHGNPESGNHQAPSHRQIQWRYLSPYVLIITSKKEEDEGATSMNATQTKLHDTAGKQNTSALQNPI